MEREEWLDFHTSLASDHEKLLSLSMNERPLHFTLPLLKLVLCYLKTEMLITKRLRTEISHLSCLSFPHSPPPPQPQLFINFWNHKFTYELIKSWVKVSEKEGLLERISFTILASNGLVVFKASFLRTDRLSELPRGLEEQEQKAEVQASNVAPTRAALGLSLLNVFCSV